MQAAIHRNSSKFITSHALFELALLVRNPYGRSKLALLVKNHTTSHRGGADGFVCQDARKPISHLLTHGVMMGKA
jgi:hypothetical protein